MPFKSEAQRRWMHWAEKKGKVAKGTAEKWEGETKGKALPERIGTHRAARIRQRMRRRMKKKK